MYKISDFSAKTGLSIKTLRYYDEINLLKPCYIDFFTKYRYYENNQIEKAKKINKLKEIDLSLEEIKLFLEENDINIIINKKKGLEEKLKQIDNIINNLNNTSTFKIYKGDYKKYLEINGIKNSTTPQALEVRDNNAAYYIIEKDNEFYEDFCIFKEENWITIEVRELLDETLRKEIISILSSEYEYITFIIPEEAKDNELINEIFKNATINKESQTSNDNTDWNYNKIRITLDN